MEVDQIVEQINECEPENRADVIREAYDDLRQLAERKMSNERADHTWTKTVLANEVSMKLLVDQRTPTSRDHFMAYASRAMRNLLIDYARTRGRQRRGGDREKLSFDEVMTTCVERRDDLLALDEALVRLAQFDARKAKTVEMLYFGGMTAAEAAGVLGVSLATVKRDWGLAKAWLRKHMLDD